MNRVEGLRSILDKARGGDPAALDTLLEFTLARIRPWVRRMIGFKLGRKVELEDIVQETGLQICKEIGRLRWEGEPAYWQWVKKIARNCVHSEARHLGAKKRSTEREVSLQEELRSSGGGVELLENLLSMSGETPSRRMRRAERFERFEAAFRTLPPDYRQVILLSSVKGIPMREVAERMGRTPAATSMLLGRSIKALGKAFGKIDSTDSLHLGDATLDRP